MIESLPGSNQFTYQGLETLFGAGQAAVNIPVQIIGNVDLNPFDGDGIDLNPFN